MSDDSQPASSGAPLLPEDMEDIDPGTARERTVLAWSRTGLSFLALGGFLVRVAPLAGLTVVALGGVVWLLGYLHYRSMWDAAGPARWPPRSTALRLIAVGTAVVALVGLVVAFLRQVRPPL